MVLEYKTVSLSVFDKPPSDVVEAIVEIFKKNWLVDVKRSDLNFSEIYFDHLPKENKESSILLWEPDSIKGYTFFMCSLSDGWQTLIKGIQEKLSCTAIRFIYTSQSHSNNFLADFEYITATDYRRICVYEENGKYEYFESGSPQFFESKEIMFKRKKKERLNKVVILNYLNKLGINLEDLDTFKSDCVFKIKRSPRMA